MAEFTSDHFQSLIKPQFPFLDHVFEPSIEDITQFSGNITQSSTTNNNNNINVLDNSTLLNFQTFLPFSSDNLFSNLAPHDQLAPPNLAQNFQGNLSSTNQLYATSNYSSVSQKPIIINGAIQALAEDNIDHSHESKKRKALNFDASESSSGVSNSPPVSESGIIKKKNVNILLHHYVLN